jgi:hypothetical protein
MITPYGDEDGAYAVANDYGERTLYFFQDEEDAERFVGLLEADEEDLEMEVVEIDPELAIKACHQYNYKYAIITPDDFVIPPRKF